MRFPLVNWCKGNPRAPHATTEHSRTLGLVPGLEMACVCSLTLRDAARDFNEVMSRSRGNATSEVGSVGSRGSSH